MPVGNETSNLYLQLGIAGATLLILLVFVILLFRLVSKLNTSESSTQNNKIEKLCDKIDGLITSNADYTQKLNTVLLSNDKDQKSTLNLLDKILELVIDTQRRVSRVDDRTYSCLGNIKKEGE